eukprot:364788-Chlamydomonas_euryale.AAC.4
MSALAGCSGAAAVDARGGAGVHVLRGCLSSTVPRGLPCSMQCARSSRLSTAAASPQPPNLSGAWRSGAAVLRTVTTVAAHHTAPATALLGRPAARGALRPTKAQSQQRALASAGEGRPGRDGCRSFSQRARMAAAAQSSGGGGGAEAEGGPAPAPHTSLPGAVDVPQSEGQGQWNSGQSGGGVAAQPAATSAAAGSAPNGSPAISNGASTSGASAGGGVAAGSGEDEMSAPWLPPAAWVRMPVIGPLLSALAWVLAKLRALPLWVAAQQLRKLKELADEEPADAERHAAYLAELNRQGKHCDVLIHVDARVRLWRGVHASRAPPCACTCMYDSIHVWLHTCRRMGEAAGSACEPCRNVRMHACAHVWLHACLSAGDAAAGSACVRAHLPLGEYMAACMCGCM